jgi:hypothetical protein
MSLRSEPERQLPRSIMPTPAPTATAETRSGPGSLFASGSSALELAKQTPGSRLTSTMLESNACSVARSAPRCRTVPVPLPVADGSTWPVTRKRKGVPCEVSECRRLAEGDGLCRMHYERRRRRGVLGSPNALRAAPGAGSRTRHGYRVITVNGRQVLEHRYVMEQHLGRPLRKGETVHHRDGNRSRNTIDNLELWTGAQPSGQRAADLLVWAEESWPATAPNATCSSGGTPRHDPRSRMRQCL